MQINRVASLPLPTGNEKLALLHSLQHTISQVQCCMIDMYTADFRDETLQIKSSHWGFCDNFNRPQAGEQSTNKTGYMLQSRV